ncbi:MAG: helix-turn-helix domain-containing protein [Syntrophaceae bacterium]
MSLPEKTHTAIKDQITNATLSLLLTEGLEATNLSKIASEANISEQELLSYFKDRREILLASMDYICKRLVDYINSAEEDIVLFILLVRAVMIDAEEVHHEDPWTQFEEITNATSKKLQEALQKKFLIDLDKTNGLLQHKGDGISKTPSNGSLPAWEIFSMGFALVFANILGYGDIIAQKKLREAIEGIINDKIPARDIRRTGIDPPT